ncbi:alpha/beta hydrolase family protein [Paraliomyxa miuraensis]|uniref:alpha/beta hydrolase family protein n=1 Tax=Paraliomyxa miuraensis TaxID=376150 RepID=UPI00224CBEE3|nr:CocE/NonD family hydrolase [Paraliomyxa miuraensis]MCX4243522.1 alpha/beta hydrolase fold domain-containing protein [Paraliomyxa miuraensis]
MTRRLLVAATLVAAGMLPGCRSPAASSSPPHGVPEANDAEAPHVPFLERRAAHATRLRIDAPSPGKYEPGLVPEGVIEVHYPSGSLQLLAWLVVPDERSAPAPALVYFHGAFALTPKDLAAVRPFVDAGFVVMLPALRGENGNPGRLELLYGEVDDAVAATRWLAARPEVDGERIYAAGHSIGGGLAALLALRPDAPVRATASVVGLYVPQTFKRWSTSKTNAELVRFDPFDPAESTLRTLGPNVRDLVHPHIAYIGDDDPWFHPNADAIAAEAERWGAAVTVERVPGDHMSCLRPALDRYRAWVEAELGR